jgi:type II secretory pathway component PulF
MPSTDLELLLEEPASFKGSSPKERKIKLSRKSLRRFASSLARLLEGGVSLLRALQVIQEKSPQKSYVSLLKEIQEKVSQGESLSAALSSFPQSFPNYFIQTLQAGELSGSVDKVLHTLALYLEKEEERMRKVKEALAYPVLVLVLAFVTLLILLQYVIPKIASLYGDYEASLPALTRFVLGLSSLALPLGIGFILSLGGIAFLWNRKKEAFLSFFFKLPA